MLRLIKNEEYRGVLKPKSICIRVVVVESGLTRIHAVYCSPGFFKWFHDELLDAKDAGSKIIAVVWNGSKREPTHSHQMVAELIKKAS